MKPKPGVSDVDLFGRPEDEDVLLGVGGCLWDCAGECENGCAIGCVPTVQGASVVASAGATTYSAAGAYLFGC